MRGHRTVTGRPSLPGLRMPCGSSAAFHRGEDVEAVAERVVHEAGAVQADAVVVAQRAARGEDRPLPGVPRGAVVGLALVLRRLPREREVEAGAVGVRVALVRRRDERVLDLAQRADRPFVDRGERAARCRRSPSCRRRSPRLTSASSALTSLRWPIHCSTRSASSTSASAHSSATTCIVAPTMCGSPSSSTSSTCRSPVW